MMAKRYFVFLTLTSILMSGCVTTSSTKVMEVVSMEGLITAVGYASIRDQRGKTEEDRQLNAMRASKLNAYQELSEQIYGVHIDNRFSLKDQRLGFEQTSGNVSGVIRGAKVVRTYPVGDTYITEMELDLSTMQKLKHNMDIISVPNTTEWRF